MTDHNPKPINRTRSRIQFILLGVLFFAPFVLAYSAYLLFPDWSPKGRVNYGELLNPTRTVPALELLDAEGQRVANNPLRDKWTLVQLIDRSCSEACHRELTLTRQLHAALGVKRERVQRVAIVSNEADLAAIKAEYGAEQPDVIWLRDGSSAGAAAFFADAPANSVMLVDPLGSWLMIYPHAADADAVMRDFKGMQKDINKLLRLSSIG
jgi:cytochrome oxidase Cu insertion factor (SCO1/SenC/PrrC family)